MDRVLIIGCPGSGKTTLSRQLAKQTGLPLIHLDQLFWEDNWTQVPREVFDARLLAELQKPRWIIDGNYGRTLPLRLQFCDTVLFLAYSRLQSPWGVVIRVTKNYGKPRPDMGGNCPERFDWEFLKSVWLFPRLHRQKYRTRLAEATDVTVHIFQSRRQASHWLKRI